MPVMQSSISSVKSTIKSIEENQHNANATSPLYKPNKREMGKGNTESAPNKNRAYGF